MTRAKQQVNFSSGRYFGGGDKDLLSRLPFDAGFEVNIFSTYKLLLT